MKDPLRFDAWPRSTASRRNESAAARHETRRFSLLLVALASVLALVATNGVIALESSPDDAPIPDLRPELPSATPRVHAFYYPWYANPETDGHWSHWDHQIILREGQGRAYSPPDDIGANFYPALGLTSSRSAKDLDQHMLWLREAGVGTLVASWWGKGSQTDEAMPIVLERAARHGIEVAFHIEPYPGRNAASVRRDLAYLTETYGSSPAFYRHPSSDGSRSLPVVYLYDSYLTPASEWARILLPEGDATIRGTSLDAIVIALWVKENDGRFVLDGGFDGFYTYFATDGFTYGSTIANWPILDRFAREHKKLFIPSVGPGYDDTRIRPWNTRNRRDREGGDYYDRQLLAAIALDPPLLSITSFNEWHEGTQIEPAVPKKIEGYTYSDYSPREPDYYLRRTREWVDAYEHGLILTVEGPLRADDLGRSLVHEHVICDFSGARVDRRRRPPSASEVAERVGPHVEAIAAQGFRAFFDATPEWIGRHPEALLRIARSSGVRIITNTGWYGAAGDKFLPEEAFDMDPNALARRWIDEWARGVRGLGGRRTEPPVRPGFIKIGVDPGRLSEIDRKLAVAACRAHLVTGLTIACHTGEGRAALDLIDVLREEDVAPDALVIVHADGIDEAETRASLARAGVWLEYDGVGGRPIAKHVDLLREAAQNRFLGQVLLSHDAGWYRTDATEPMAGFRPYRTVHESLVPALREAGIDDEVIARILEVNPTEAFRVRVRRR